MAWATPLCFTSFARFWIWTPIWGIRIGNTKSNYTVHWYGEKRTKIWIWKGSSEKFTNQHFQTKHLNPCFFYRNMSNGVKYWCHLHLVRWLGIVFLNVCWTNHWLEKTWLIFLMLLTIHLLFYANQMVMGNYLALFLTFRNGFPNCLAIMHAENQL